MSLLLSQVPAPFNPANGFPYEQQPSPPAHGFAQRCVALALTACSFVAVPPPVDPSSDPTWLPSYPDFPARGPKCPVNEIPGAAAVPPFNFGTAVDFNNDPNSALRITTFLPGPQSFSVACFFQYTAGLPSNAGTLWMLQDTASGAPTHFHNLEINSIVNADSVSLASDAASTEIFQISNITPDPTDGQGAWYFVQISVGTGGAATAYWCKVGTPIQTVDVSGVSTGWTPASFSVGGDNFAEFFPGAITGMNVWSATRSSSDAAKQATQIAPVVLDSSLTYSWKLEHAATKTHSEIPGRDLTPFGAGTWTEVPGPFLQPGNLNPAFGFPYEQQPPQPPLPPRNAGLLDDGGGEAFVFVPPSGFDPANGFPWPEPADVVRPPPRNTGLLDSGGGCDITIVEREPTTDWLPDFPDFARAAPRPVNEGGVFRTHFERTPTTDWLPDFPDFARPAQRPVNQGGRFELPRAGLGAIRVDSAADALRGLSLPVNNSSYTAVGWVQYDSSTNDDSLIFVSDAAGTGLALEFKTGVFKLVDTFGFSRPATLGGTLVNGKWYFVGLKVNGTTATIYLGSETDATQNSSGTIVAQGAAGSVYLSYTSSNFLTGGLSRWRLYDAQLSDAEVEQERLADVASRTSNLVANWLLASEADKLVDSFDSKPLVTTGAGTWENIPGPKLDLIKLQWLSDYPDFPGRAAPRPVNQGGQVFWTNLEYEPTTDWAPEYPDFAGRAALRPVNTGGQVFWTNVEREPTTDWLPDFPDFARAAPRPVNQGGLTWTNVERVPTTDWLPDYPDFARAAARPVNQGGLVWTNLEREPDLDWSPEYPDFARATPRPVNQGGLFWTNVEREPTLDWAPQYPDFAGRAALRPVNEGGYASLDNFDFVPKLAWAPTYPDFARSRQPLVPEGQSVLVIQEREPTTDWLPDFPDFPGRAARRPVNEGGQAPFDNFDFVPKLSWSPSFPDFALARRPLVPEGQSVLVIQEREPTTDWLPDFPDFARAAARPVNTGGLFWTNVEREPTTDWLPQYPDFPGRARQPLVREGEFTLVIQEREPTTDWLPDYPDFARSARAPVNVGGAVAPIFPIPNVFVTMGWFPDYPDFARAALRPLNTGLFAQPLVPIAPAVVSIEWLPEYPDFARSKPSPVNVGGGVITIQEREPAVDWLPDYPDFARAAQRPVNQGGLFWTNLEREPAVDWLPDFPDFARAQARALNTGGLFWTNVEREPAVDWLPEFPDFPARAAPRPVNEGGVFRTHLEREPDVDWLPDFPDFARAKLRPVNEGGSSFTNFDYAPKLAWSPVVPDFARAPLRPVNEGGSSFDNFDFTPKLAWSPTYPDFARAKLRPVNEGGESFLDPDFVPKLAWSPGYPDFALAKARPINQGGLTWTNLEREPDVDWLPQYPDFARAAARPVNQGGCFFVQFVRTPVTDWMPDYPDFARAKLRPVNQGGLVWTNLEREPDLDWSPTYPDFATVHLRAPRFYPALHFFPAQIAPKRIPKPPKEPLTAALVDFSKDTPTAVITGGSEAEGALSDAPGRVSATVTISGSPIGQLTSVVRTSQIK